MPESLEEKYNGFIVNLEARIEQVKIKIKADADSFEKTIENRIRFYENYTSKLDEHNINRPYPIIPLELKIDNAYYVKALNEGRKRLLSLQTYFEEKLLKFNF